MAECWLAAIAPLHTSAETLWPATAAVLRELAAPVSLLSSVAALLSA